MTWADTAVALKLCEIGKAGQAGQSLRISVHAESSKTTGCD